MSLNVRRIVTGHDADGRAVVKIDEMAKNVKSGRPGASSCVIWSTSGFPVNNDGDVDPSAAPIATTIEGGSVFRMVRYEPGVTPRNHRTDSIDYAVVISGAIEMELDGGVVKLSAGDLLVQRGTIHNWVNRGTEPCLIAFVLISGKPVTTASGRTLRAIG
jgi:quercetin dioxygenase-like cupin family protein